ncbi:MAG: acyl carrier protein [Terrimicrobiaceae bacterium]
MTAGPVSIETLRALLAESVMLKSDPAAIGDNDTLFGPEGIGLDSLDALQIIIAVEKRYGISIGDATTARDALKSLAVLRDWINTRTQQAA